MRASYVSATGIGSVFFKACKVSVCSSLAFDNVS